MTPKCEKCLREMVEVGAYTFICPNCDRDGNNGGICLVVE